LGERGDSAAVGLVDPYNVDPDNKDRRKLPLQEVVALFWIKHSEITRFSNVFGIETDSRWKLHQNPRFAAALDTTSFGTFFSEFWGARNH